MFGGEPSNTPIPGGLGHRLETPPPPPHGSEPQSPPETARKAPPRMAELEAVDTAEEAYEDMGVPENVEDDITYRALQMATLYQKLVQRGIPSEVASSMAATTYAVKPSSQQPSGGSNHRVRGFLQQHGHVNLRIDMKLAGHANYESWRRDVKAKAALLRASHILSSYENYLPEDGDSDDCLIWQYKETKLWEGI
ncbi:hypothetical protein AJ78_08630 [Emergomyces pasteurianus Ep9510]|uniref:Uncharacterized protein n=1 Tax=Emergomyces pasteurianus Ep9510 TaxID=1447872 RepID=A0A1J9P0H1_9EURO|nr:hypothetical protein AJ78_08630 [Emergomyces pasteurianus Ep9510]